MIFLLSLSLAHSLYRSLAAALYRLSQLDVATRKTILQFSLVSHACMLLFFARPRPLSDVRLHLRVRILGDRGRAEPELYCTAFEKLVILEPRA